MMSYEEYLRKVTAYESSLRRLGGTFHQMSPTHPVKKHLRNLIIDLKALPDDVLTDYLERRHGEDFKSGNPMSIQNSKNNKASTASDN